MKTILTWIFVLVSLVTKSQDQTIVLCSDSRTEFTYTVSANTPLTSVYWYVDGVLQYSQSPTINWLDYPFGIHNVTVYGFVGDCRSMPMSFKVLITGCSTIYIPNVFTPDNDGVDDLWYPVGVGWEWIEVMVFDRWGEQVWWSNEIDGHWNGSFRNGLYYVQIDVYVYKVTWKGIDREPETIYGHVSVVR